MEAADANTKATNASKDAETSGTNVQDSSGSDSLRQAIVRALSTTVNGCMTEMAYFPGMPQMLQDLRNELVGLQEQNAKLHGDNINLSRIVNQQKEHIASLTVKPPEERDLELEALRNQLRSVATDRDSTARAYQHMRMAYQQSRRECAELVNYMQQKMPGMTEYMRSAPPPGMVQSPTQMAPENAVIPPFAISPQSGPPGMPVGQTTFSTQPTMGIRSQAAGPQTAGVYGQMPNPRVMSTSSINTSMSRINLNGGTASPGIRQSGSMLATRRHSDIPYTYLPGPSSRPGSSSGVSRSDSRRGSPNATSATSKLKVIDLTGVEHGSKDEDGGPRKKRRVDEEGHNGMGSADTSNAASQPASAQQVANDGSREASAAPAVMDETEDDGLDPDGRRSEQACLDIAFEKDADGAMWCAMCRLRFNKNLTQQAPNAFIDATVRELVEHCEKEHPVGWATLRKPPDEV